LNGGPGCSDSTGLFSENGPFQVKMPFDSKEPLKSNKYSWNYNANLLFIDNPIGAGLSIVPEDDYQTDENAIAENIWTFLLKFYELFPN